ncbi:putative galactose-1-phosphate uridylyltransferase [Desulforapulum autotrophicum HRM2]|uniref:Galactose-1-phosphate uridylyltransferase n=1 Tax=Desulforapulum autotrophicum (strain ATCC 43914 / DSM 3382 / VKM B-1955 / HRM2) TaxID=177437 RepID=C0QIH0_DESAH|nr:galactose-1-phosphate uridylyltransferase [Desulforapulum autotrophicum]ACN17914.1 putative galactose-1-phosphate uridylyltransferase [Desulforapulum autotrophicum HRM2]
MIRFERSELIACFKDASGNEVKRVQEIRTDPVTLKQCRIVPFRALEKERGTQRLFSPPQEDLDTKKCPFCPGNLEAMTPQLLSGISETPRLCHNRSILFPNLFPYTEWSAVSIFDNNHHVEIGSAPWEVYQDSFINCADYLSRVAKVDPSSIYMSITQNHLPGAGGSLVHPHLQVHASKGMSNHHRLINQRTLAHGRCMFSDLLAAEKKTGQRYIGSTGSWEWIAAFAPSGFYEIWGISTASSSLLMPDSAQVWQDLAKGVVNVQKYYKSLNRNAYNLALISTEDKENNPHLKVSLTARSSYAPWVRSDFTGFEIATGEMATFILPEDVAAMAAEYWQEGAESTL